MAKSVCRIFSAILNGANVALAISYRVNIRDKFLHAALNVVIPFLYRDLDVMSWRSPELIQKAVNSLRCNHNEAGV